MHSSGAQPAQGRASIFVPVELQERGFLENPLFRELHDRAIVRTGDGLRLIHPWIRWQDFSAQLDCIAYADRSLRALPSGRAMNPRHVTPGRLYTISAVILAHALGTNIAAWLGETLVPGAAGERHFLNPGFCEELARLHPAASELLQQYAPFVRDMEHHRGLWMHATPDDAPGRPEAPLEKPPEETEDMVRSRPAAGAFTAEVFRQASGFYLDWLGFSLRHVK